MSTQRQVKRSLTKSESKEAIGHLINVARRHEQMLHAMDQYIEQLENILISKGIMSKEDVEKAANAAIEATKQAVLKVSQPEPSVIVTDEPIKVVSSCGNEVCADKHEAIGEKDDSYEL